MKIALLGATGGTGLSFIGQALAAGHQIIAVVRTPSKITVTHPNLEVRRGDVFDVESLNRTLTQADVVVSAVGVTSIWQARKTNGLYSVGTSNIIRAMKQNGLRRLIVVGSSGVEPQPADPWIFKAIIKPLFLENMYADMRIMEKEVKNSGLDWTIVRPPQLVEGKLTGTYRVSREKNFDDDKTLSRDDLAHFLLEECDRNRFERAMLAISY